MLEEEPEVFFLNQIMTLLCSEHSRVPIPLRVKATVLTVIHCILHTLAPITS